MAESKISFVSSLNSCDKWSNNQQPATTEERRREKYLSTHEERSKVVRTTLAEHAQHNKDERLASLVGVRMETTARGRMLSH